MMLQVWLFIAPGLYAKEKKLAIPFVVGSSSLFIAGAAFSHYVLFPAAWTFFAGFSNDYIEFTPRIDPVFGHVREAGARHRPRRSRCRCSCSCWRGSAS